MFLRPVGNGGERVTFCTPPSPPMSTPYFDAVAPRWDSMRSSFFPDAVREKAIAASGVRTGGRALDVGAGTGFVSEALLERGVRVVAVDASPEMVRLLEARLGPRGLVARLGDAERLPVEDDSADGVFANMCLHHVERPGAALREMTRAAAPGGAVVVTDLDAHGFTWLREEHHDRWMGFERAQVAAWMREAGLVDVAVEDASEECCASSGCGGADARIGIFLARGVKPR